MGDSHIRKLDPLLVVCLRAVSAVSPPHSTSVAGGGPPMGFWAAPAKCPEGASGDGAPGNPSNPQHTQHSIILQPCNRQTQSGHTSIHKH